MGDQQEVVRVVSFLVPILSGFCRPFIAFMGRL